MLDPKGLFMLLFVGCCVSSQYANAQMSGTRATELSVPASIPPLTVAAANSHIAVEGTCQKRVTPTSIRLIWAVTAEDKDAATCRKITQSKIEKTTSGLTAIRVGKDKIFEDFVSAIPRFEWIAERREDEEALVETETGYRMQTNLHIAVETNEQAMKVVEVALTSGLTDLIGVDYAADLEQAQNEARLGAIAAAKKKSETLLSAIFEVKPKTINVQEHTQVRFPNDMYDSFENIAANNLTTRSDDRRHRIAAYRPKNTYYAGQTRAADNKSYALPMKPEIVVESKVVIYYQSPSDLAIATQKSD
jgi:uncharacterized protein YggE